MTNNKLCNILGCGGCGLACWCLGLVFFGFSSAMWGAVIGIICMALGLVNYD